MLVSVSFCREAFFGKEVDLSSQHNMQRSLSRKMSQRNSRSKVSNECGRCSEMAHRLVKEVKSGRQN